MSRQCCNPSGCKITVVFARVGESEWYPQNLFCGWAEVNLSSAGVEEAIASGKILKKAGYKFDIAYTSMLNRAQQATERILKEIDQVDLTVEQNWKLNERNYGALTGLDKKDVLNQYDPEEVKKWRMSYDIPPPPLEADHPYYKKIVEDPKYANLFASKEFPKSESLKMQIDRTVSFWNETVAPRLKEGKRVLMVANGNSLRGLIKHLDKINEHDIMSIYIPRAVPFYYILDRNLNPAPNGNLHFLGDSETVEKALDEMHNKIKI